MLHFGYILFCHTLTIHLVHIGTFADQKLRHNCHTLPTLLTGQTFVAQLLHFCDAFFARLLLDSLATLVLHFVVYTLPRLFLDFCYTFFATLFYTHIDYTLLHFLPTLCVHFCYTFARPLYTFLLHFCYTFATLFPYTFS